MRRHANNWCKVQYARKPFMQGTARTFFYTVVAFATLLWCLMLALAVLLANTSIALPLLLPTVIMAGLTVGACWTLMAITTSELFGLAHFSLNYAMAFIAPLLASCLCPKYTMYNAASRRQHWHRRDEAISCFGKSCFLPAVPILCFLSVLVRPGSAECMYSLLLLIRNLSI